MSSEEEMFQAQFYQHPNPAIHYENIDRDRRNEHYRQYKRCVQLLLDTDSPDYEHPYKLSIQIYIGIIIEDVRMMQEEIQYHRSEVRRLRVEIATAQRNTGEYARIARLIHHQKTHQWVIHKIQQEFMGLARYTLAPRIQNT